MYAQGEKGAETKRSRENINNDDEIANCGTEEEQRVCHHHHHRARALRSAARNAAEREEEEEEKKVTFAVRSLYTLRPFLAYSLSFGVGYCGRAIINSITRHGSRHTTR